MRHLQITTLMVCALCACGEDVSLGSRGAVLDAGMLDDGVLDGGGICTVDAGAALDMPCGNVMCNGAAQYCSPAAWPDSCKPLPCECASAPPSQQSCACLLQHITPDCDAGATCTNNQSGLVITCK